ncbi:hypothetical protein HHL11_13005 [Ramlibacter sp. G-1-2-2]|uniref:Uncharacterized protein n=1 Tax=Ramlibacter agri TaxID=2728837 RepID=A0A848H120_9BURK|nr:hypothetical protein [Ramlibacter agri]NML44676.1 hypothetical protein [Ramlibacter agri]
MATMLAQRSIPPAALLRSADVSLRDLARGKLPRLHALSGELRREAAQAEAAPLLAAFAEHLAASRALRFELLIPPGLRAAASRADEAAFRVQVQRVVDATAGTWTALRFYMGASAGAAARCDVLLSEFVMQARGLERGSAQWGRPLEALRHATAGEGEAGDLLRSLLHHCDAFAEACEGARRVRRLAHEFEQQRAGVQAVLHKLAHRLGGGLLERLRPMIAGMPAASRDEIGAAQAARQVLEPLLAAAAVRLQQLEEARSQLAAALEAVERQLQPAAWSETAGAPLAAEA